MTTLIADVGGQLFVKAAVPATFDKAGYEAVFASSALPVTGAISISERGVAAAEIRQAALDGIERIATGGLSVPNITVPVSHVPSDAAQTALLAGVAARTVFSVKHVNGGTGLVDYFHGIVSTMPKTEANGDTSSAGYIVTFVPSARGYLVNQTAPA